MPDESTDPPVLPSKIAKLKMDIPQSNISVPQRPPPIFSPGDDFSLWAFRAKLFLKNCPDDAYFSSLISFFSDDALRQILNCDLPTDADPLFLWSSLESIFGQVHLSSVYLEKFWSRSQHPAESVDEYVATLRDLAAKAFSDRPKEQKEWELLRKFTLGVRDSQLKTDFLKNPPKSLMAAVESARPSEATKKHMSSSPSSTVPSPSYHTDEREGCYFCARFGKFAQKCGHNPPLRGGGRQTQHSRRAF